ncbi:MAG: hypothetical protein HOP16_05785 [Acidobacteria bacterium]|nr:hypothetical protein [Acidobacteriota bacterium]
MTVAASDPLGAVRNLAGKAWRRALAAPRHGVRLVRRAGRLREQAEAARAEWGLEREIAQVARGRGPIIAGPWLSEVGFEVLYWVPFLRWFQDRYRVDPERIVAISRGGVADWYGGIAGRYVEIFDHLTPEEFGRRNRERHQQQEAGGQKQTTPGDLDAHLIQAARDTLRLSDAAVCHPSLMYRLFNRFWFGNRALDLVLARTRYEPIHVAPMTGIGLPERYVAAKFYTGGAVSDTPEVREALRGLVRTAAARMPVVMLDTGMTTDEHEDYLFRDIPNVVSVREHLEPRSNLGVQTRIIAGSRGYLGTCGSLAWMAPMLGVDTLAVYSEERFLVSHVYFAAQAYRQCESGRFDTLDLRAATELEALGVPLAAAQERM